MIITKKNLPSLLLLILIIILVYLAIVWFPPSWALHAPFDNTRLAEKVKSTLGMNLSDLENSLVLSPVITGEEPFILTYSIPIDSDVYAKRCVLILFDNGQPAHTEFERQPNGTYQVAWNTTFVNNGQHILQVKLHLPLNEPDNVSAILGTRRIENVNNMVRFDPNESSFESRARFHGFLAVPSADYKINIYDTNKNLLRTITGHTGKGVIDEVWDLKTTNGQVRTDEEFYSEVFITPTITDTNGLVKSNAPTTRIQYP